MTEWIINSAEEWGIWGVLFSLFIEGSAFPFIGTFFIVTMGFILRLTWMQIVFISLAGSLLYTVGSYIPYYISLKLGDNIEGRLKPQKLEKLRTAQKKFNRYGVWSVAIASPLHLGNVIPFLAGVARMDVKAYSLLTMLGIAPSTFLFLTIGKLYDGEKEAILEVIEDYQMVVLVGFVVVTGAYMMYKRKIKRGSLPTNDPAERKAFQEREGSK
ncbi:DedA family protein [Rossellomorea vietnamensis]|uniref:DedA family protein n=1 Tax=Rossellomorea vietnamensis TaxID=218284 RepID=UPI001E400B30|nr:VTT domain-containing protein [Rossellomorea vietnamensis]MCC5803311.1 VTT domain-containing protein [Rossellomorea vietnamensis]